jgi:NDP-sugar pyrophosphorylase family protein
MLNIVVPMAGRGSRFSDAGYAVPKPAIPIRGMPMVELVAQSLRPARAHRFTFLVLKDQVDQFGFDRLLHRIDRSARIVTVDTVTEGAACTVLLARAAIDNDDPLMLANSDQWVDMDIDEYLAAVDGSGADGLIMTMTADDPKWSYVGLDSRGRVNRVVEKQVISPEATVGIYNFRRGRDFVWAADEMIRQNRRVNNEFYVAPVYNEMIARGARIDVYSVGSVSERMWGLGTPADLELFIRSDASSAAVARAKRAGAEHS